MVTPGVPKVEEDVEADQVAAEAPTRSERAV